MGDMNKPDVVQSPSEATSENVEGTQALPALSEAISSVPNDQGSPTKLEEPSSQNSAEASMGEPSVNEINSMLSNLAESGGIPQLAKGIIAAQGDADDGQASDSVKHDGSDRAASDESIAEISESITPSAIPEVAMPTELHSKSVDPKLTPSDPAPLVNSAIEEPARPLGKEEILRESLEKDPQNGPAYLELIGILSSKGDLAAVRDLYDSLLKVFPLCVRHITDQYI